MGMIVNANNIKVMIIKSKNITYDSFIYNKVYLEEVPSYKYLGSTLIINLIGIIALRNG